ncbi:MAG TPA: GtrA family protein, partial [Anaerolineales bacterium]|nr:GtrA family protein [Anaerolineales bacterium]
ANHPLLQRKVGYPVIRFLTNPAERGRFLRFAVVGVIGAVVDFGTFNFLEKVFNVAPIAASIVSFSAAIVSNFLWNRFWTYPDSRSKPITQQLIQFAIISVMGLIIRTPIFAFMDLKLIDYVQMSSFPSLSASQLESLAHNIALAIAVGVVMFWNFFINRFWTYNDVRS